MDRIRNWLREYVAPAPAPAQAAELTQIVSELRESTGVDLGRARVRAGFGRGHLLELSLELPGGSGSAREQAAAEELVRRLLGAPAFERWIGSLAVVPAPRGRLVVVSDEPKRPQALALAELPATIAAARRGLYEGLPEQSHARASRDANWVLFELSPEPAHDYAQQDDLALATTSVPELKKCFLRGEPFFSGRFSRHGELFVYLKYEGSGGEPEARLRERGKLEQALERCLRPELGALVGAGFGLRYGYLDLALSDPLAALEALPKALRAARAPKRSWLLFCDSELEDDYLAIWPETSAPYLG